MGDWKESRATRLEAHRKLAAGALKKCPLCGAINAIGNGECFVCTWHGEFDHDPDHVEEGLGELMIQCPELADAMADTPVRPRFVNRLRLFWKSLRNMFGRPRNAL